MTSETFILGGPILERIRIGARVRRFAATLGAGHVEALLNNHSDRVVVCEAHAYPVAASDYDIRAKLQQHLNADKPTALFGLLESQI
jgi:hypothetical protein